MKIALLLSGQIREAKYVFPYTKGRILDKYNPDVFISTWSPSQEINDSLHAYSKHLFDTLSVSEVVDLYNPKMFIADPYEGIQVNEIEELAKKFSHLCPQTGEMSPVSVFMMWFKIKQSLELLRHYETQIGESYDYIIKGRFDIRIHDDLFFDRNLSTICVPPGYDWRGGVGDLIAWGGRDAMEWYCSLFDFLPGYIESGVYFHAETLLRHHLEISPYNLERPKLKISLREHNVWEKEPIGEKFDKKSYRYIESRGNIWDT